MSYFDAEAYAEGICNSASGASIETLVDLLDALATRGGGVIDDAIEYRWSDDKDEDGEDDREQSRGYERMRDQLEALREAIVKRERADGEVTTFNEEN